MDHQATVLLVEDDPSTRTVLATLLEDEGYKVLVCGNGAEAKAHIDGGGHGPAFDVVITDLKLPDMTGMDLLGALNQRGTDVPFILVSGHATLETAVQAVNEGAYSYQVKPLDTSTLMSTVRNAVKQRQLLTENRELLAQLQRSNEELEERNWDLEQASFAKMQILSTASHEFKTPLTSIVGYVNRMLLQRDHVGDLTERQEKYLETVKKNAHRLKAVVDDLLDISRIESGGIALSTTEVDVRSEVEEAIKTVQPDAERKRILLSTDLPADLPQVKAERLRFSQILVNLLSNACKYSLDAATVKVTAACQNGSVRINVADTGIGISRTDQVRLFTQFFRAETQLTREEAGTGLGLSITKHIVEAHGGEIWVESQVGQGTTVSFTIPVGDGKSGGDERILFTTPREGSLAN